MLLHGRFGRAVWFVVWGGERGDSRREKGSAKDGMMAPYQGPYDDVAGTRLAQFGALDSWEIRVEG